MPIATTELTTGGVTSPPASQDTASVSPSANALLVIDVRAAKVGATAPDAPTVTGSGLTWVQVATQTYTDGVNETHRLTRFRAMGAAPSSGALTIAHAGNLPDVTLSWTLRETTGVDTSGTNGSGAIVQVVTNLGDASNGGAGTTASATLAAFADAVNNAVDIGVGTFAGTSLTPEAGYTGLTQQAQAGNLLRAAWKVGEDTSPSMTIGASTQWAVIAAEIKAAFPNVAATATTNGATAATNKVCNLPASIASGDLLIVMLRSAGADTHSLPTGWSWGVQNNASDASDDVTSFIYKVADGTEGTTVTINGTASLKFASLAWRITGHNSAQAPEWSTVATGTSTTPNPSSLTPTGGAKNYLWLWAGGWEGEQTSPPASNPTSYSANIIGADSGVAGAVTTNARCASATRKLNAASEDPGSWTISVSDDWSAWTIAVHPAPAGGGGGGARQAQPLVIRSERRRRAPMRPMLFRTPATPPADTTLAAALSATASVAPALSTAITAATALSATGTLAPALTTSITAATALNGTATFAGQLTTAIQLASATTGSATLAADLLAPGAASRKAPVFVLDARTRPRRRRAVESPTLLAAYQTPSNSTLAAALSATASVAPALSTAIRLATATSATATLAAPLTTAIQLATGPSGTATLAGALATALQLAATPQATATLSPTLSVASELAAVLAASATLSAQATTGIRLATAPASVASLSADVAAQIRFAAAFSGNATLAADLFAPGSLVILGELLAALRLTPVFSGEASAVSVLKADARTSPVLD